MLKNINVTLTRFKQNEDQSLREAQEDVDVLTVKGSPEFCYINSKSGDPIILKGQDLVDAIRHVCPEVK